MPNNAGKSVPQRRLSFIDLFAGVGGFTLGFMDNTGESRCEFVPRLLVDVDRTAREVFVRNKPHVPYLVSDVHQLSGADIKAKACLRPDERLDLLIGGPPCQGFSFLGRRALDDKRNLHVVDYLRLVKELRPLIAVMENVPLVMTNHGGAVIKEVCTALSEFGYASCAGVLVANEYGVPQIRKRAFVIAYHGDLDITPELPRRTHERVPTAIELMETSRRNPFEADKLPYVSVEEAIGDLPMLKSGEGDELAMYPKPEKLLTNYQRWVRTGSPAIFNHRSRLHSNAYLKKISVIEEGGRNMELPQGQRFSDNYFSQAYARLHRNGLANTITTSFGNPGSGRFLHYRDLRSITVREAARLQSFPDTFVFDGDHVSQMRHVGNAVPPILSRAIRDQIARDLLDADDPHTKSATSGVRPVRIEDAKHKPKTVRAVPSDIASAEVALRQALTSAGIRGYRLDGEGIPGNPEVVFRKRRVVVFIDGCVWHGCPKCQKGPATNETYSKMKVQRNQDHDALVTKKCTEAGWRVVRLWEHDVLQNPCGVAKLVKSVLDKPVR